MGPILERFWGPKLNQNRSKIGLKSDHEANAKIFKNIGRGCVFEDASGRRSIKNRLKNDLMLRCQNNNPKMSENIPTCLQIGSKLGPCWVPKSSWTRPRAKKMHPRGHSKRDQKKYRKTSVWGGSQTGSAGGVGGKFDGLGP